MKKFVVLTLIMFLLSGCGNTNNEAINNSSKNNNSNIETTIISSENTEVKPTQNTQDTKNDTSNTNPATIKVSIPEGYTFARIAETLEAKEVCKKDDLLAIVNSDIFNSYPLIAAIGDTSTRPFKLEGYLSPATYEFKAGESPENILKTLLNQSEKVINSNIREQAKNQGFTVDEIIILASMIEKECKTDSDRYNVSAIFRNRLAQGKQLQSCATIKYVEGAVKPYITGDVNRYNSLINTYKAAGLPSSPICSPGIKAIQAALNPTPNCNYLYFFSDANGILYFSSTYEEHQQKMKQYGVVEAYNQT